MTNKKMQGVLWAEPEPGRLDGGAGGLPEATREAHPPSASAPAREAAEPPPKRGVQRVFRRRTPTQVLAAIMLETLERLAGEHAVGVGMTDFYCEVKPLLERFARGSTS